MIVPFPTLFPVHSRNVVRVDPGIVFRMDGISDYSPTPITPGDLMSMTPTDPVEIGSGVPVPRVKVIDLVWVQ